MSRYLLPVLLLIHLCLSINFIVQQQITFDEPGYADYSKRWLKGDSRKTLELDDSKTPLTFIAWLPRAVMQVLNPSYQARDWGQQDLKNGRFMFLLFFYGIIAYVYLFAKKVYGRKAACISIILVLIDPLFMIYGLLINSDIISGFMMVACMYHYFQSHNRTSRRTINLVLAAVYFGLGLATKQGFIFLPVALLLIYFARLLNGSTGFKLQHLLHAFAFGIIATIILNSAFYFQGSFLRLSDYSFHSTTLQQLQHSFSWYNVPLLIPQGWMQGVDWLQYHAEIGPAHATNPFAGVYINGHYSTSGIWFYYVLAAAVKFPLALLSILLLVVVYMAVKITRTTFTGKHQYLIVPTVVFLVIMSLFNPFQIGVRHLLIVLPLAYVFAGGSIMLMKSVTLKVLVVFLAALSVVEVATYYPDIIPFTNLSLTNKTKVHRFIYDTSIDYGQADRSWKEFLLVNSDYQFAPTTPAKGKFIVPARFVMDKWDTSTQHYRWLSKYQPVGNYRYVYLLYHIK